MTTSAKVSRSIPVLLSRLRGGDLACAPSLVSKLVVQCDYLQRRLNGLGKDYTDLARENRVLLEESFSRCREQADNRSLAMFSGVFWGFFGVVGGSAFGLFVLAPWLVSAGLVRVL